MTRNPRIAILLEVENAFDRQLLRGIGEYSRRYGPWSFRIVSDQLAQLKPPADLWGATGIIARTSSRAVCEAVQKAGIPVVTVEQGAAKSDRRAKKQTTKAYVDMAAFVRMAGEHLAKQGFQRMTFVGIRERGPNGRPNQASQANAPANLRIEPPFLSGAAAGANAPWALDSVALGSWLSELPKPIGILACDDHCGFQVLEACQRAQIKVPSEVAVMGVGNDELLCALANPSLSSIALAGVDGGYRTAYALDCLMNKTPRLPDPVLIQATGLVVRSSTDVDMTRDPHVSAARNLIHRHGPHDVSIKGLAATVGVSRRTLELKFRKHVGRTVFEEIQEARLSKAKTILKETELPISRVAISSGYRSVAYFIRVFGKETGLTPAKYRAAARVTDVRYNGNHGTWKVAE